MATALSVAAAATQPLCELRINAVSISHQPISHINQPTNQLNGWMKGWGLTAF